MLLLGCTSPQREGKEKREGVCDGHGIVDSEGSDVIECVVQLFTDGLVLHLLCIDFIWTVRRGGGKGAWGEEMEEGRRRGWREDDEMETRTRGMDRRERPEDRPKAVGLPLPLLYPSFSLSSAPRLFSPHIAVSQKPVGSALSRQAGMLKRER